MKFASYLGTIRKHYYGGVKPFEGLHPDFAIHQRGGGHPDFVNLLRGGTQILPNTNYQKQK